MAEAEEILFERAGAAALVTLNRPQALNALTLSLFRRFDPMLRQWEDDPAVRAIVVRGAGGRAFCAGGDVRAVYEAGRGIAGERALTSVFFREEYRLIHRIHRLATPYVAIIDGITMGGGAGLSVNGAWRVATERTMLAMPETAIGLFPDVGATWFLNRCPGRIGRYLALTGARIGAADALYCGFATHVVPPARIDELVQALGALEASTAVPALLAAFAADPGPAPLAARRDAIDRCFAGATVEAILDALAAEPGEWAAATRAGLADKSPTSLKLTLRQLDTGKDLALEAALRLEYRLIQHVMAAHDFYEGVRARLVDKDQHPRWQPANLGDVTEAMVDGYFASLGAGELIFE